MLLPPLPYPDFPLRPHQKGSWYKSAWNRRLKKTEQFYFGSWKDDPKGERAQRSGNRLARPQGRDQGRRGTLARTVTSLSA